MTTINKVSKLGFDEYFDIQDTDTMELLYDIEEVNFRLNDETIEDS